MDASDRSSNRSGTLRRPASKAATTTTISASTIKTVIQNISCATTVLHCSASILVFHCFTICLSAFVPIFVLVCFVLRLISRSVRVLSFFPRSYYYCPSLSHRLSAAPAPIIPSCHELQQRASGRIKTRNENDECAKVHPMAGAQQNNKQQNRKTMSG